MEFGEMKRNTTHRIGAIFTRFRVALVCQRQLGFLVGLLVGYDLWLFVFFVILVILPACRYIALHSSTVLS